MSQTTTTVGQFFPHELFHLLDGFQSVTARAIFFVQGAASDRPSCSLGASLRTVHSPASGNSRRVAAKARCAATTLTKVQPMLTAPRNITGSGRWGQGRWPLWQRSRFLAPPVSAAPILHQAATLGAHELGVRLAPFASGSCVQRRLPRLHMVVPLGDGLTTVASTAGCEPCHRASPLATTSMPLKRQRA